MIITAFVVVGGRGSDGGAVSGRAPDFSLPSTTGGNVSLDDFSGRNLLLYFNEGAGCDACFYQTVEIERNTEAFTEAGIAVVGVVANPMEVTLGELARFGLATPYLVDADTSVSSAYGMLGQGMHANLPGHGFVLIDGSGELRWKKEYPTMYVSAGELLDEIRGALAGA